MNCIHCGDKAAFDRVVVALNNREVVGCLCCDCEELVGELESMSEPDSPTCGLCRRPSGYALPEWDVAAWEEDETVLRWLEYEIGPYVPILCETHYESLTRTGAVENGQRVHTETTAKEVVKPP